MDLTNFCTSYNMLKYFHENLENLKRRSKTKINII